MIHGSAFVPFLMGLLKVAGNLGTSGVGSGVTVFSVDVVVGSGVGSGVGVEVVEGAGGSVAGGGSGVLTLVHLGARRMGVAEAPSASETARTREVNEVRNNMAGAKKKKGQVPKRKEKNEGEKKDCGDRLSGALL